MSVINARQIPTDADRLAIRHRPDGRPVMHQNWGQLLFMHWRLDENLLRPLIPRALTLDLYGGSAWLAITPFTMWDIRPFPPFAPRLPGLNSMHELNVRTYVHHQGVPGVWFFSLDANSEIAAAAARTFFHLPYRQADIQLSLKNDQIHYSLQRTSKPAARFEATWSTGHRLPEAMPGSREFFLTERYCLYTENDRRLYRARIYHEPWQLHEATLEYYETDLFQANRLPSPSGSPLVHYAPEVRVDIWFLERIEK